MSELIWDGKYDLGGKRSAPVRVALPFQTVETVNESAQQRQQSLDLFAADGATDWRNRLIWGDKKYVLPALLTDFAGRIDLIYIDPPFATGQDFSLPVHVGSAGFVKEPSVIEIKAYRDTWGGGLDSYLQWFYDMTTALYGLLSERGSLCVHLDPGVAHLVKVMLDEVFGPENFRNEIIWRRTAAKAHMSSRLPSNHDTLLTYTKSDDAIWNADQVFTAYDLESLDDKTAEKYTQLDSEGRPFQLTSLINPNADRPNLKYEFLGVTRVWRWTRERMQAAYDAGLVVQTAPGRVPRYKRYLDEQRGKPLGDVWDDISPLNARATERVGYPTQKPVELLERLIRLTTVSDSIVLDCVCGSGTTAVAAERLDRRWIACDLGRFAIHTTRKRLLSTPSVRPFVVQNLGKYERQLWQSAQFGQSAAGRVQAYRKFILDLFHATPVTGFAWLHGVKNGRMVHVGTVDSPVTTGDITQTVSEFRRAVGTGTQAPTSKSIDVLGWDFAFELNEIARQNAERAGIDLRLVRIPREVLEKRAAEQGDIKFFELAALSVAVKKTARKVTLAIEDFVIPLDDVPADVQRVVTHWSQWIDYWAVDWDNKGDTFHNEWQAYRTRRGASLDLTCTHQYADPGDYTVVVKVIDILGNDTTKTIPIKVVKRGEKDA